MAIAVLSVAGDTEVLGKMQFRTQLGGFSGRLGGKGVGLAK